MKQKQKKFRIPRKIKKRINTIFLYPPDERGSSLMASIKNSQEDYTAYKQNILRPLVSKTKAQIKEINERYKIFDVPTYLTDDDLKFAITEIFGEEFRDSAYSILSRSKNHDVAKVAYYNFVNAYNMTKAGGDESTMCCMSLDLAEENLQRSKPRNK